MKTIKQYIDEQLIYNSLDDNNGNIISEGFWDKLKQIFGYSKDKVAKTASKWSDNIKNAFATTQYVSATSKDKEEREIAKEQGKAAEKSTNELLIKTKEYVQKLMKRMDDIKQPDHSLSQYFLLSDLSKAENDSEGLELAKKFKGLIDKKWPDGGKKFEKIQDKVKNSPVKKQLEQTAEQSDETKKSKEESTIGINDKGEQEAVTKKQETNEVEKDIKDDTPFYKALVSEAGIKGTELRDSVVKLINASFKQEVTDKKGNKVYKWKTDTKGFQTKNEDKLIKGLSSIVCGLLMINHKGMNEAVVDTLINLGFSKQEILDKLLK